MTLENAIGVICILAVLLTIACANAAYWKAKAETLHEERNESGWAEEARFWRRIYNKEAAEAVE